MSEIVDIARARALARSGRGQEIRERAGVSRSELAKELGRHETTVARWEGGERSPRGAVALRYGQLLTELEQVAAS